MQFLDNLAPKLQGAANGTIAPQGADATYVTGVNTAGTVRVNNLANLEALLNILANGMEVLGIAWGGPTLIYGFMKMAAGSKDAVKGIIHGCCCKKSNSSGIAGSGINFFGTLVGIPAIIIAALRLFVRGQTDRKPKKKSFQLPASPAQSCIYRQSLAAKY